MADYMVINVFPFFSPPPGQEFHSLLSHSCTITIDIISAVSSFMKTTHHFTIIFPRKSDCKPALCFRRAMLQKNNA